MIGLNFSIFLQIAHFFDCGLPQGEYVGLESALVVYHRLALRME